MPSRLAAILDTAAGAAASGRRYLSSGVQERGVSASRGLRRQGLRPVLIGSSTSSASPTTLHESASSSSTLFNWRTPSPVSNSRRRYTVASAEKAKEATRACPSCGKSIPITFTPCPACSTLLPLPQGLSHHSLLFLSHPVPFASHSSPAEPFDIPAELSSLPARGFLVEPRDVRSRMLTRQRDLHPDKYAVKGDQAVELAKELSGRINKAYDVLANPLKRAEYIVATEETDSLTDPDLLSEILEAREELEEAGSQEAVEGLRELNHDKVQITISQLTEAFSAEPPNLEEAKTLAIQLKYWLGLEAAAKEWQPGRGAGPSAGSASTHS